MLELERIFFHSKLLLCTSVYVNRISYLLIFRKDAENLDELGINLAKYVTILKRSRNFLFVCSLGHTDFYVHTFCVWFNIVMSERVTNTVDFIFAISDFSIAA